jgi:hypothetical protein
MLGAIDDGEASSVGSLLMDLLTQAFKEPYVARI